MCVGYNDIFTWYDWNIELVHIHGPLYVNFIIKYVAKNIGIAHVNGRYIYVYNYTYIKLVDSIVSPFKQCPGLLCHLLPTHPLPWLRFCWVDFYVKVYTDLNGCSRFLHIKVSSCVCVCILQNVICNILYLHATILFR